MECLFYFIFEEMQQECVLTDAFGSLCKHSYRGWAQNGEKGLLLSLHR